MLGDWKIYKHCLVRVSEGAYWIVRFVRCYVLWKLVKLYDIYKLDYLLHCIHYIGSHLETHAGCYLKKDFRSNAAIETS